MTNEDDERPDDERPSGAGDPSGEPSGPGDARKRQLIVMAGLLLALGAAMAIGTRGDGGGRRGGFVRTGEGGAAAAVPAASGVTAPSPEEPIQPVEGPAKGEGGDRGDRAGEQSVDSRQGSAAEADGEEAAQRAAHEEKLERTREAIDQARREGRSADAKRLQERLDDLEERQP